MASISTNQSICHGITTVESGGPIMSAVMFSTGAAGNLIALVLLGMRHRQQRPSLFHVLATALVMTDLLGTFAVSPIVLISYHTNMTLIAMSGRGEVCNYFGFSMTLLSLSTLAILCAMALERYVAIGHPYFYERNFSKRCGYITIPLIYIVCVLFCAVPFMGFGPYHVMGFGPYVQYCPGTWCFLDMQPDDYREKVFTGLYAFFIFIMISCTVVCNISVIYHLIKMDRRRKARCTGASRYPGTCRRSLSVTEEVEHLLVLVFITVAFVFCSFPLVIRVYVNFTGKVEERHAADLTALRLLSFNSIIDPWVFIILSPSVLRFFWRKLSGPRRSTLTPDVSLTVRLKPPPPDSASVELRNGEGAKGEGDGYSNGVTSLPSFERVLLR